MIKESYLTGQEYILVYNLKLFVSMKKHCLLRNQLIYHSELFAIWKYPQDQPKRSVASLSKSECSWACIVASDVTFHCGYLYGKI